MSLMLPDLEGYFRGFVPPRDELLLKLEGEAEREGIPIVGPVVGELLFILARAAGAAHILELGTATGYSTIYLGRACDPAKGRVLTLEQDAALARRARSNFARAGLEKLIEVREGDAFQLMGKMSGPFDFIFMDIDKEGYLPALPHCLHLLKVGGLMVTDNVGFSGAADFNREIFRHRQCARCTCSACCPGIPPRRTACPRPCGLNRTYFKTFSSCHPERSEGSQAIGNTRFFALYENRTVGRASVPAK